MIYLVSNQTNAFGGEFTQVTLSAAIAMLDTLEFIGTDTETKGLDCFTKDLLTIQLGNKDIQIVFLILYRHVVLLNYNRKQKQKCYNHFEIFYL